MSRFIIWSYFFIGFLYILRKESEKNKNLKRFLLLLSKVGTGFAHIIIRTTGVGEERKVEKT